MVADGLGCGADQGRAVEDEAAVQLHQRGTGLDFVHRVFSSGDTAHADNGDAAVELLGKGGQGFIGSVVDPSRYEKIRYENRMEE